LYFLTSLLAMPVSMQDMFVQATTTVMSGYFVLVHYQLFQLSPMLVVVPVAAIGILLSVRQIMKKQGKEEQERLKKLKLAMIEKENEKNGIDNKITTPKEPEERKHRRSLSSSSPTRTTMRGRHVTRRASLAQGIQTAQAALLSVAEIGTIQSDSNTNNSASEDFSSWFDEEEYEDGQVEEIDDENSTVTGEAYFPIVNALNDSDSEVDIDEISYSGDDDEEIESDDEDDNLHKPKTSKTDY
jgi:hypothetical protein